MPGIDYQQLRQQVSMSQVLGLIGFRANWRRGPQVRGPCPIPDCSSTSRRTFSAHLLRQGYHCFACGAHGNALDLWAAIQRLPLHHAAIDLCRTLNLVPPRLPSSHLIPAPSQPDRVAFRAPSRNH
jgi:DNA primase